MEITFESNIYRTPETSIQKLQFENQSFDPNFFREACHPPCGANRTLPQATKKSVGFSVTGKNTNVIKVISIFMQYCERLKVLFLPTQNHHHPGTPALHKSQGLTCCVSRRWGLRQSRTSFIPTNLYNGAHLLCRSIPGELATVRRDAVDIRNAGEVRVRRSKFKSHTHQCFFFFKLLY